MNLRLRSATVALLCGSALLATATASTEPERFADEVAERHDLDAGHLRTVLAAAEHDERVLERIASPAEGLPWHDYREIFLTEERLEAGLGYWAEHQDLLAEIHDEHRVPEPVILAILGVESYYGTRRGDHRVLDALTTLGFSDHPRAGFFRDELEAFLLLSAENEWDATEPTGSYAGALGKPQFIPSSYRAYAVDQDGDGRRDLLDNPADAAGSAAHYLARHGWEPDAPVARAVEAEGSAWRDALAATDRPVAPRQSVDELAGLGVEVPDELDGDTPAALIELEGEDGTELWLTLQNFYVLTRYNHSALYAMAVHQLAEALAREHAE
ncbi:lytic murein transglycosylase B [Halorhodospira halophila]|uniref:Lytic murein transglycosylase B n=1 Tax=Halorhodospira halophila (strain DSM 244 / SL1) TaxID=349124 RepID=A1WVS4_HALHL|nr:lytic murein transglycosylase B [Halorhodospira halophila]ABM61786.1 lytic murein transglycosylase B [Halorhodospira halophila SL1]MBK1728885.1 lytic murein transglycosylase B [Halorhodospira halophila]